MKVLITGASKGLGRAIAREFASLGYDIIFTYLTSTKEAQELETELKANYNINVKAYKVDLTSDKDIDNLINKIDTLDVLINNAAYNCDTPLFEKDSKTFEKILRVNLVAPFILSQKLYSKLKSAKGNIINIASTNGIDTMYEESLDYDASKAGLINLTKSLATSFAPDVRVNGVAPGWIDTEALIDMNPKFKSIEESKILLNRFAEPEEVARLVKFIGATDTYMTGSIIRIDGGKR